jgi:hypothetical protein
MPSALTQKFAFVHTVRLEFVYFSQDKNGLVFEKTKLLFFCELGSKVLNTGGNVGFMCL